MLVQAIDSTDQYLLLVDEFLDEFNLLPWPFASLLLLLLEYDGTRCAPLNPIDVSLLYASSINRSNAFNASTLQSIGTMDFKASSAFGNPHRLLLSSLGHTQSQGTSS